MRRVSGWLGGMPPVYSPERDDPPPDGVSIPAGTVGGGATSSGIVGLRPTEVGMTIATDTEYDQAALQAKAHDHLWMHFTRIHGRTRTPCADHRARRGHPHLGRHGQAVHRRPRRAVRGQRQGTAGAALAEAAASRPRSSPSSRCGRYAHPTAIELAERLADCVPRRPQQGLLHHRRRRGRRDRLEARQALLQAQGQAHQAQGHLPRRRLSRHPAGRPVDHRPPGR